MLSQQEIEQFQQDGFINGGPCLTSDEVDELRAEMERVIAERDNPNVSQPPLLHNRAHLSAEARDRFQRILNENVIPNTSEYASLRAQLEEDNVTQDEFIADLRERLNQKEDDNSGVWQIVNIWMVSPPFRKLIEHSKITHDLANLSDAKELRVWHDQIQYKPAKDGGQTGWHQDAPAWPVLTPMNEISAWVALDDIDESNGCMSMVPGSHKWGDQTEFLMQRRGTRFDDMPPSFNGHDVRVVRRPVQKGEVHYHHALTWHGSHANKSGRPRRAIAIHYMPDGTRFNASGQHPIKHLIDVADSALIEGPNFPLCYSANAS